MCFFLAILEIGNRWFFTGLKGRYGMLVDALRGGLCPNGFNPDSFLPGTDWVG